MTMKEKEVEKRLLSAAVAGVLGASILAITARAADNGPDRWKDDQSVKCYGVNKCAGQGACKGKAHGCGGKVDGKEKACGGAFEQGGNSCKGAGFLRVSKSVCEHLEGGSLDPIAGKTHMGGDATKDDDDDDKKKG